MTDLVMAEMYAFARWQGVEQGLVVVDCAADRMVRLTTETRIDGRRSAHGRRMAADPRK
jgi:hypothetical protein